MSIAYLDPATGSIIVSAVVAGSAGAGVAMRSMMAKLRLGKRSVGSADLGVGEADIATTGEAGFETIN